MCSRARLYRALKTSKWVKIPLFGPTFRNQRGFQTGQKQNILPFLKSFTFFFLFELLRGAITRLIILLSDGEINMRPFATVPTSSNYPGAAESSLRPCGKRYFLHSVERLELGSRPQHSRGDHQLINTRRGKKKKSVKTI